MYLKVATEMSVSVAHNLLCIGWSFVCAAAFAQSLGCISCRSILLSRAGAVNFLVSLIAVWVCLVLLELSSRRHFVIMHQADRHVALAQCQYLQLLCPPPSQLNADNLECVCTDPDALLRAVRFTSCDVSQVCLWSISWMNGEEYQELSHL